MIELKKVTDETFKAVVNLNPGEGMEKFVAPNVISLAQAYVAMDNNTCTPMPFAIYKDDVLVGFIQIAYYTEEQEDELDAPLYEVWRFMIDEKEQGKGYGKEALSKAVDYVKTMPCGEAENLYISFVPGNEAASHVYEAVGFKETGQEVDGETVMLLKLK